MAHTHPQRPCTTNHAVILAAGESKRTRPLTLHRPKPLIPLLGKPLLAHILDELVGLVEQATLVVGYRADAIRAHFGDHYHGIRLHYVLQREVNGTASALSVVADQIDEPFFLLYGDNLVSHADLVGVCQDRYSLAALHVADPRAFGVLDIVDGNVQRIIEKPTDPPPNALANPGIYHFDAAVFPLLQQIAPSPRGEYELTDIVAALASQHTVGYHVCQGYWVPVGTPWDALNATQFLLARRATGRSSIDAEAEVAPGVTIEGPVWIGKAQVAAGARLIGPLVLGDGCSVAADATIAYSVLEPGAQVGVGSSVEHAVVGQQSTIGAGCTVQRGWLDGDVRIGDDVQLRAQEFADLASAAEVRGLLSQTLMRQRGSVLAQGVVVADGTTIAPGSVLNGTG